MLVIGQHHISYSGGFQSWGEQLYAALAWVG